MRLAKLHQRLRHDLDGRQRRQGHMDGADLLAAQLGDLVVQSRYLAGDRARAREHPLPHLGQENTAGRALEERYAQIVFRLAQGLGERGLRLAQRVRRGADAAGIGDSDQGLDVLDLHAITKSYS